MRKINTIAIHHSQNRKGFQEIKDLHVHEYKWDDIGYHFVIDKKGDILNGRNIEKIGAHVHGYNDDSVGICLIGNFDIEIPNKEQINSLLKLINELKSKYDIKEIKMHRDFPNANKTCPGKNFNLNSMRKLS